ncbi:hypothetical protein ACFW1A_15755 [Kitasatospora sp. NPDC058965]|uniref:hypothetical protein n=1 Tax=Kitasatospora sp. NPDC058965 TaxID=3346682 RepID=UPI0036736C6E
MESVPWEQGDLRWVFPELADTGPVAAALAEAGAGLRQLGGELVYHQLLGVASLGGHVERAGREFVVSLACPRRCAWELRWGPPWQVVAEVTAGDAVLAERQSWYEEPLPAARALAAAVAWLQGQEQELEQEQEQEQASPVR